MNKHLTLAACLIAGLTGLGQAEASTLNFICISSNVASDCSIGQSQLSVDVNSTVKGVSFTFKNNVGSTSSITEVYFDASTSSLSGVPLPAITDSDGSGTAVIFSLNANPSNLPGGSSITPPFNASTSTAFTADSDAGQGGQMIHGVNAASEWLTMDYALISGKTYTDIINELGNAKLRLGVHVTGFSDGNSASFVNNPVPVPAAAWLLGSGLIGLAGIGRRKITAKAV